MNNLGANYKIILGVLQKISKNQLLTYQRRKPKLSDLELISLSITAEYMGIDSENDLFRRLPKFLSKKIERSVYNRRRRKLFHHTNHIRIKLAVAFNEFESYFHLCYRAFILRIEEVVPTRANEQWVSDITYIGTRENPMYLALITDAYFKKIVGYDVSDSLDDRGCLRALQQAIKGRKDKKLPLIHHSDRGLQYCSDAYQELLAKNKIQCSMTESYDPYANAVAERVNGILKQEFKIDCYGKNIEEKKVLVADAIKKYNTLRPHYSCHYLTPEQMHKQSEIQIRTYKKNGIENQLLYSN
uniref:IS3 family transposase n=1 Tax=Ornithobacterium rhinotracheale TaxID=28251 RepID=UPI0039A4718B